MKKTKMNNFQRLKIFLLRLLRNIFVPIFLITTKNKIFIYNLFPNEFSRVIALILVLVAIFVWFIYISNIIRKAEEKYKKLN